MATGLKVWVYRPDIEAAARKINRNFIYNARGETFFDVFDRENATKTQINELKEKIRKQSLVYKVEVPCE